VADDPDFVTMEITGYGFKINFGSSQLLPDDIRRSVQYMWKDEKEYKAIFRYIEQEHSDRTCGRSLNPGNSWIERRDVWEEFLHNERFAYTYSDRITPQLLIILGELSIHPFTRQAIINIHSNINPGPHETLSSIDLKRIGAAGGRIPCSLHYQFLRRLGKIDLIYSMRSCDFLTHFLIDIILAIRLQSYVAHHLDLPIGTFTYFTGSLHAYRKDMRKRGIF
jgi:thymidylate synthase